MSTIEAGANHCFLSEFPVAVSNTGAASGDTLVTDGQIEKEANKKAWDQFIDSKLIEWGRDPGWLEDEDLIPPSQIALGRAVEFAYHLRAQCAPAPKRVVPDGDGGIVFERWNDVITVSFEISEEGSIEFVRCDNGSVAERIRII